MVYEIPPNKSQRNAFGSSNIYKSGITKIQTQPMAIYIIEESHLGQKIQNTLMKMLINPRVQIIHNIINPLGDGKARAQMGV